MGFASKILFVFVTVVFIGCSNDENKTDDSVFLENAVVMKIQTSGEISNFLDTVDPNDVTLYYVENAELNEISNSGDYPKGFFIFEEADEKFIKIFSYVRGTNSQEQTLINWGNGDLDTLSYQVNRYQNGSIAISSIAFNGTSVTNNNENGIYFITKD